MYRAAVAARFSLELAFSGSGAIIKRDFTEEGGAHQPNEYIKCDKFVDYTKIIAAYILKVLGK